MRKAYTLVHGLGRRDWDVGSTYPTRKTAEKAADALAGDYDVMEVTCHVDDFTAVDEAMFMVRTDGIHEVSFVVAPYDDDSDWGLEYPENARVNTRLIDTGGRE